MAADAGGGPLQLGSDHGREPRNRATCRLLSDALGSPGAHNASRNRPHNVDDLRQTLPDHGEGRAISGREPEAGRAGPVDDVDVEVQVDGDGLLREGGFGELCTLALGGISPLPMAGACSRPDARSPQRF
jgi:hypothetical protein